ncbi:hypothetical protein B7486_64660, partial [cyanobacterium TDX16]
MGYEVGVLGGLVLAAPSAEGEVELRPFERRVLAAAAFEPERGVSLERMEALVWAEPPATARKALQTHVARIRGATGPELLVTTSTGYRLGGAVLVDRVAFEQVLADTAGPVRGADLAARRTRLIEGLALWRGVPYADLDDHPDVRTLREQLREQRRTVEERLAECRLALGEV